MVPRSSWEQQAFDIWERYFPQLVLADGSFIEQSSHYHLLLCRTALEYTLAARHTGRGVPPELMSRLRRMFLLADNMLRPDGSLARFGDNSPDHIIEELWGLLTAARFHGLLDRSPRHGAVTPLTIYYGAVRSLEPPPPAPTTSLYTEGGWAFLRTDDGLVEMVAHGDPTSKLRSHGDAGQGSFELFVEGESLFVNRLLSDSRPGRLVPIGGGAERHPPEWAGPGLVASRRAEVTGLVQLTF